VAARRKRRYGECILSDCLIVFSVVEGETEDAEHPGAIAVQSWTWEVLPHGSVGSAGEAGRQSQFTDLVFTQTIDKSTPILVNYAASHSLIETVHMYMRRAGGEAEEYFTMSLKDVVVKSVSIAYGGGSMEVPKAVVALSYREVEITYKAQDDTGKVLAANTFMWELYAQD
jgi:type VI secretion system secreted protein Hcp